MKKNITILCSNLKGNLGDFAIAEAVATAARRFMGECSVRLYYHANKPVDPKRLEAMLSETRSDFESILAAPYYRRPYWLRLFCRMGIKPEWYSKWHNREIIKVAERIARHRAFIQQLENSDLVVFAGGAQWGRGDLNLNMFGQLKAVNALGKPVCAFPFSVSEGLVACNGRAALVDLFSPLKQPVFVRDAISSEIMRSAEVDSELVCDSVFSLRGEFDISWDSDSAALETRRIVYVSLTRSGSTTANSVAALLDSLKSSGLRPVLFSNCEVEDRPFYDSIQQVVEVEAIYPASWKQAVAKLAGCRFVITNRLHCLIFSALSGTPVIPVTNRLKSRAYVVDASLPCSLESPSALTSEQVELFNRSLEDISAKQKDYATACSDKLNERLADLFLPEGD